MLLMVAKQWSSLQIKEHLIVDFTFFFRIKINNGINYNVYWNDFCSNVYFFGHLQNLSFII